MVEFNTPPRNTTFRVPQARQAKTFRMEFDNLGTLLGPYNANRNVRLWDNGAANALVLDELYDFGKKVVVPLYQREAPVKEGSGGFPTGYREASARYKAGFGYGETWHHTGPHLRDRIQAIRSRDPLGLTVRMPWYGRLTITGRGELPYRPEHPYRIELPGGAVIYRQRVGPATFKDGSPDLERMEWADRAYQALQKRGWFRQLADNIAVRMFLEVMYPLLKDNPSELRAREKPFLQGYVLQKEDGYTRKLHHASFTGYKPLRVYHKRGNPHSNAVNRGIQAIRANRLHKRTTHLRALQDNPATRSAANRVRAEHAETLERHYGKYNIPFGRNR